MSWPFINLKISLFSTQGFDALWCGKVLMLILNINYLAR